MKGKLLFQKVFVKSEKDFVLKGFLLFRHTMTTTVCTFDGPFELKIKGCDVESSNEVILILTKLLKKSL